jgi:hypothetical protein
MSTGFEAILDDAAKKTREYLGPEGIERCHKGIKEQGDSFLTNQHQAGLGLAVRNNLYKQGWKWCNLDNLWAEIVKRAIKEDS